MWTPEAREKHKGKRDQDNLKRWIDNHFSIKENRDKLNFTRRINYNKTKDHKNALRKIRYNNLEVKPHIFKNYEDRLLTSAKERAKRLNLEFSLAREDIIIPIYCPVLGFKLNPTGSKIENKDFSPSLDRLDNSKGYTKDNTKVISWRANKIKSNATLEELESIVNYIRRETNNI